MFYLLLIYLIFSSLLFCVALISFLKKEIYCGPCIFWLGNYSLTEYSLLTEYMVLIP